MLEATPTLSLSNHKEKSQSKAEKNMIKLYFSLVDKLLKNQSKGRKGI